MNSPELPRFGPATPGWSPTRPTNIPSAAMLEAGEPRRRWLRRLVTGLAALVVAAGLFLGGRLTAPSHATATFAFLETTTALPAGDTLTRSDLTVARLTSRQSLTMTPSEIDRAIGQRLATYLPGGALLRASSLMPPPGAPTAGQALVGLALRPGQLPQGGVVIGDHVEVVILPTPPTSGAPTRPVKITEAPVWAVSAQQSTTAVTVLVPLSLAPYLAEAASDGQVALVNLGFDKS